ncbi:MAG: hypothetical protein HY928_18350 [Elusimicrobia bacterium]|nr:hypothetical protein [Elusimicrobiota bacterium]
MKQKDDDLLHNTVVAAALAVLGVVLWVGGSRLYRRWQAGRPTVSAPAQPPPAADDGIDRPPSGIPPLSLVGLHPRTPNKPKPQPAAVPKPPITPDRE